MCPCAVALQHAGDGGRQAAAGSGLLLTTADVRIRKQILCELKETPRPTSLRGNANWNYLANACESQEGNIKLLFLIMFTSIPSHFPPVKDVSLGPMWQAYFSPKTPLVFPLMAIINFIF